MNDAPAPSVYDRISKYDLERLPFTGESPDINDAIDYLVAMLNDALILWNVVVFGQNDLPPQITLLTNQTMVLLWEESAQELTDPQGTGGNMQVRQVWLHHIGLYALLAPISTWVSQIAASRSRIATLVRKAVNANKWLPDYSGKYLLDSPVKVLNYETDRPLAYGTLDDGTAALWHTCHMRLDMRLVHYDRSPGTARI